MDKRDILSIRVENVDAKQIPDLIQAQFEQMSELKKEITCATSNAYDAKENVINEVGSKIMSKKTAIENLQNATLGLANAQIDAMKAQKKSFEYQQKLADTTKFLFRLGLSNIAMNRVVVEELEYRLRNASQEEIDDLERAEIENLLKRLKAQQDIDQKQAELKALVEEQNRVNDTQQQEIKAQSEKDEEHDRRIDELYAALVKQDEIVENVLLELDEIRKELYEKDNEIKELRNMLKSL